MKMTFYYFTKLPYELQSYIFSINAVILKLSPYISTSVLKVCKEALGNCKIDIKEFKQYITSIVPEHVYIYKYIDEICIINKLWLIQPPLLKNQYRFVYKNSVETIKIEDNNIVMMYDYMDKNIANFDTKSGQYQHDLLTQYFIYQSRLSLQDVHCYAQNKIINNLILTKSQYDLSHMIDLLSWYMYLRTNLLQFPVKLQRNQYYDYKIMDNDPVVITQLTKDCDVLYKQLYQQLKQLS